MAPRTVRAFLDCATAKHPERPFLVWGTESYSYAAFSRLSDQAAAAWHELGIGRGDVVAFILPNSAHFLMAWFGLAKIGAVLAAMNPGYAAREIHESLMHCQARHVLTTSTLSEVAAEGAKGTRVTDVMVLTDAAEANAAGTDFLRLLESCPPTVPGVGVKEVDPVSLVFTSGTTGKPKAVIQTHRNYVLTGEAYPSWLGLADGARIYSCLPLFHIGPQAYSAMGSIGTSGTVVLAPRFSATKFWDDVVHHNVNAFNFIGAMAVILTKQPASPLDRAHQVRIAYGVPALPPALKREVEGRFGLRVISGFGMSETTFGLIEPLDEPGKPGSMGIPRNHPDTAIPRTRARVVTDSDLDARPGETGELLLKNAAMMKGYLRDRPLTRAVLRDGWLSTGDLVRRDEDGYMFYVARKEEMLRIRGENVAPVEVETVFSSHPEVMECAVIGVPSAFTDEDMVMFVVSRSGSSLDASQLLDWASRRLARHKLPRFIQFVSRLPKTPSQKVAKHRLKLNWRPDRAYDHQLSRPGPHMR